MFTRQRGLLGVLIMVLACGWVAAIRAEEETPKFQFKPVNGTVVIRESRTTETLAVKDGPSRTRTFYDKSKEVYAQTETGYKITDTLLEVNASDPNSSLYQVMKALKGKAVTLLVDREGNIQSITGIEPIVAEFRKKITPSMAETEAAQLYTVEGMTDAVKQGWEGGVLEFIGHPAKLGEAWVSQDEMALPDGSMQKFYVAKKVSGRAVAQGKQCLRIQETANTDPEQFRGFLGAFADTALADLKPIPSKASFVIETTYVIDPETLNEYEGREKQRVEMLLEIPEVGEVSTIFTKVEETKNTYQFPKK